MIDSGSLVFGKLGAEFCFVCKTWRNSWRLSVHKELSRRNSRTESNSGYVFNASFRLLNEIMENSVNRSHKLYCKMDSMADDKRRFHRYTLETGMSSEEEQSSDLRASSSKHMAEISSVNYFGGKVCKSKVLMNAEVEQLNERLKTLEEEAEVMKKAFLESSDERKELIYEIYQKFHVIHHFLHSRNQETGEKSSYGTIIVNRHKNERKGLGLSQILCQDSNPSIVIRAANNGRI